VAVVIWPLVYNEINNKLAKAIIFFTL
jgi:hypothetical protein